MNSIQTNLKNEDGSIETLLITSNDNYSLNLNTKNTYKLANHTQKKENKLTHAFKKSILGTDIGINSEGFSHVAILSTIIAVGAFCIMYLFFKI